MVNLTPRKVGIIACSGEEIAEGTISRAAAYLLLQKLRPAQTVTLCLPLFLAGGQEERAFAKVYPTIAIDGCDKRCAARATEAYSAKPAAEVVVSEIAQRFPHLRAESRRELGESGRELAGHVAEEVAGKVDQILTRSVASGILRLGRTGPTPPAAPPTTTGPTPLGPLAGTAYGTLCLCQAVGPKVTMIEIGDQTVGIVGLDDILQQALAITGLPDDDLQRAILQAVKAHNYVAPASEGEYAAALWKEFATYRARKGPRR